ncbi:MAG: zf-HC2 domain-containing protein [Armatimonadetes bacterium]|nr:zf-HC2 domain-containing protein [Armatimonadota bacterium]
MTMRCQEALERLVEGLTGSVPPADREAVIAHLATCARCRQEAVELEATAARLRESASFTVPPGFWPAFMNRLTDRMAQDRLPLLARVRRWLGSPRHAWATAVVTAMVVIALSAAARLQPRSATSPDPSLVRARGLVTETMTVTLPSLAEMLDIWRAGMTEVDPHLDALQRRSP